MKICTLVTILSIAAGGLMAQDKGKQGKAPAGPGLTLTTPAFRDELVRLARAYLANARRTAH